MIQIARYRLARVLDAISPKTAMRSSVPSGPASEMRTFPSSSRPPSATLWPKTSRSLSAARASASQVTWNSLPVWEYATAGSAVLRSASPSTPAREIRKSPPRGAPRPETRWAKTSCSPGLTAPSASKVTRKTSFAAPYATSGWEETSLRSASWPVSETRKSEPTSAPAPEKRWAKISSLLGATASLSHTIRNWSLFAPYSTPENEAVRRASASGRVVETRTSPPISAPVGESLWAKISVLLSSARASASKTTR